MRLIAQEVGCSYSAVLHARNKFGIKIKETDGKKRHREYDMSAVSKASYKKKYPNGRFGELASNWRGGRRPGGAKGAYIRVYVKEHPFAVNGYVMEHRLVIEKSIGRYLTRKEQVHHRNGDKKDNRLENLELHADASSHQQRHAEVEAENNHLKKLLEDHGIAY